jgi:hypothetical protein
LAAYVSTVCFLMGKFNLTTLMTRKSCPFTAARPLPPFGCGRRRGHWCQGVARSTTSLSTTPLDTAPLPNITPTHTRAQTDNASKRETTRLPLECLFLCCMYLCACPRLVPSGSGRGGRWGGCVRGGTPRPRSAPPTGCTCCTPTRRPHAAAQTRCCNHETRQRTPRLRDFCAYRCAGYFVMV